MYLVFIIHFIIAIHTATLTITGSYNLLQKDLFFVSRFWSISLGAKLRASNAVSRWQNPYTPPYVCVVQLVECLLAMQEVAGSYPVTHSNGAQEIHESREVCII